MSKLLKQSQLAQPLLFLMIDSTDHLSGKTGLTPTVTISKNGGTFAAPAGAVTELGSGWYKVAGNATDAGTLGPLLIHATGTGADPCDERYDVVAFDPQATSLGLVLAKTTNITGFNDVAATAIVSGGAITTSGGAVSTVTTVGTLTTYTGNTPQTGDSFARIGVAGVGLTNLGDTRIANLDAAVSTRSTYAGADTSGTTMLLSRLTSQRGANLDNLDATVASRLPTSSYTAAPTAAAIATAVWTTTTASDFATASSPGKILATQLGGAFTTASSSVFTTASLANGPSGGGGGSGVSLVELQGELDTRLVTTETMANLDVAVSTRSAPATAQTISLTQALTDVKTATVGGALHGAWTGTWGKFVKDVAAKTLKAFGIGSQSVAAITFDLDSGTDPTTRTPQ